MTRSDVLREIKKFFDIDELVCNHTLARWGQSSWQFLDTAFLETLLIIRRDIIQKPMWCNNHRTGQYQRGLRCNRCSMVSSKSSVYLSAHCLGKAGDFTITGMTAEEARNKIRQCADRLPYPVRLERGVSWLHVDTRSDDSNSSKCILFNG